MSLLFYLFMTIICSLENAQAQNLAVADSLENLLLTDLTATKKIDVLNELAWVSRKQRQERALEAANLALNLSREKMDLSRVATSLNRVGEVLRIKEIYPKAAKIFLEALEIERSIDYQYGIARALGQLSTIYNHLGKMDSALVMGRECLNIYKKINRPAKIANAHQRIVAVYENIDRLDLAIIELNKKLKVEEILDDPVIKANTLQSLGRVSTKLKSYDQAIGYYNQSVELLTRNEDQDLLANIINSKASVYLLDGSLDKAESQYNLSLDLFQKLNNHIGSYRVLINLGVLKTMMGHYLPALKYYFSGLSVAKQIHEQSDINQTTINIGNVYQQMNNPDSAEYWYNEVLKDTTLSLSEAIDINRNLAEIYQNTDNQKLYDKFLSRHLYLRDSLDQIFFESIRLKDNLEESRKEAELLEKDLKQAQTESEKQKAIIIGLVVSFALVLTVFFFILRYIKVNKKRRLAEKNEALYKKETELQTQKIELQKQKIDEVLREAQIKQMDVMHDAQQKEKNRIARELHDKLGGTLSTVKLYFESMEKSLSKLQEKNLIKYEKAITLLNDACEDVRSIAYKMGSDVLNNFGLIEALKNLDNSIGEIVSMNITISHFGLENERLPYEYEINIYRIIQELISNAAKHAEAKELSAQLMKKGNKINLIIEDDGKGFDPEQTEKFGMGIKNIQTRVQMLAGELKIDSGLGSGTTFIIDIPLKSTA